MRIALFHNVPSGGAKRAIYEWTQRLAARHRIDAYTLSTADHDFCDVRPWVERHVEVPFVPSPLFDSPLGRFNQAQRWRDLGRLMAIGRSMAASVDDAGYDVVFAHTCQFTFIPTLLLFVRRPAAYYLHEPFGRGLASAPASPGQTRRLRALIDGVDPMIRLYRRRLSRLQERGVSGPTRFLANSAYTATRMRDAYETPVVVCPPGVDFDQFRPRRHAAKQDHIISVGELSPRKGFPFLIESLGLLPAARRPSLRIVCNSEIAAERQHVECLARERGVTLEIRSGLNTAQLVSEYNDARVCAVAAVNEPFGLVALEAMACGTPVVGVREGGVPESVVHERTGLLVERRPEAFAAAVLQMLSEPSRRAEYARNARAHVEATWGWDRSVAQLERQLQEVAATAPSGAS